VPPQPPVCRSTKLGTLPAAIFSCSGWPLMASPSMNWLCVHTEAMVVISLIVTLAGALAPSTVSSEIAGLSPPPLPAAGVPPRATRYSEPSASGAPGAATAKRPSAPLRACASGRGVPLPACHSVTDALAMGAPPPSTWPSRLAAAAGSASPKPAVASVPMSTAARRSCLRVTSIGVSFLASWGKACFLASQRPGSEAARQRRPLETVLGGLLSAATHAHRWGVTAEARSPPVARSCRTTVPAARRGAGS
jgi:hypothetical protein